jgi:pyridoxamine 5'-phosphate oxidase
MTATPSPRGPEAVAVALLSRLVACHDLPTPLPDEPMALLLDWFKDARDAGAYDDPNAMTLATAAPDATPAARIVLCQAIETDPPGLVFYTAYPSRKGRELDANPRAAAVFHWPHAKRQARIEGRVQRTTDEESDAFYRTRPFLARVGARVGPDAQSTRSGVLSQAARAAVRVAAETAPKRPEQWGGYRIIPKRVELWSARSGKLHDRAVWEREAPGRPWTSGRLGA